MMKNKLWLQDPYFNNWLNRFAEPYRYPSSSVIAAIIKTDNELVASYDHIDETIPEAPDIHTLFEIGSITKVFTTILLAGFSLQNKISLDMPAGRIIDELAGVPDRITPRSLATHTSGLPRLPDTLMQTHQTDPLNPYQHISEDDLFQWMKDYRPEKMPETSEPLYSNLGMGLLGQILAKVGGQDYFPVLHKEVLEPLGLIDTVIQLSDDQKTRLAIPHTLQGAVPPWDLCALAGAGALRSTMNDLIRFSRSVMTAKQKDDILSSAIVQSLEVQVAGKDGMSDHCMGWIRLPQQDDLPDIYFHNGGTGGSSSELFICPEAHIATIMLANHNRNEGREYNPVALVHELVGKFMSQAHRP